jgi:hypothetical protein
MKFRVALLVNLGSLVAWFFLVPLVVLQDVPVYDAALGQYVRITDYGDVSSLPVYPIVQWKAFSYVKIIASQSAMLPGIPAIFLPHIRG